MHGLFSQEDDCPNWYNYIDVLYVVVLGTRVVLMAAAKGATLRGGTLWGIITCYTPVYDISYLHIPSPGFGMSSDTQLLVVPLEHWCSQNKPYFQGTLKKIGVM